MCWIRKVPFARSLPHLCTSTVGSLSFATQCGDGRGPRHSSCLLICHYGGRTFFLLPPIPSNERGVGVYGRQNAPPPAGSDFGLGPGRPRVGQTRQASS